MQKNRSAIVIAIVTVQGLCAYPAHANVLIAPPPPNRLPELNVVVSPSPGYRPSWCPSTRFNGANLVCETPGNTVGAVPFAGLGAFVVTLRFDREVIWSGRMQIRSDNGSASVSMNRSDEVVCQRGSMNDTASQQISNSFNIRIRSNRAGRRTSVSVDFARPFTDARTAPIACSDSGAGSRGIRFDTEVDLSDGRGATLTGDGGLTLTIVPSMM